jgi:hypothetical protein
MPSGRSGHSGAPCRCNHARSARPAARELDQAPPRGLPGGLVGGPRRGGAGVAERARHELGGELVGRPPIARRGEIQQRVVLVAAAQRREPQRGLAARQGERAVEVAVVIAVVG